MPTRRLSRGTSVWIADCDRRVSNVKLRAARCVRELDHREPIPPPRDESPALDTTPTSGARVVGDDSSTREIAASETNGTSLRFTCPRSSSMHTTSCPRNNLSRTTPRAFRATLLADKFFRRSRFRFPECRARDESLPNPRDIQRERTDVELGFHNHRIAEACEIERCRARDRMCFRSVREPNMERVDGEHLCIFHDEVAAERRDELVANARGHDNEERVLAPDDEKNR